MKQIQISLILFIVFMLFQACTKKQTQQITSTSTGEEQLVTVEFKCPGMHCEGCEQTITEEIKKLEGIKEIKADAKAKLVRVVYIANKVSPTEIEHSINAAGYDTESSKTDNKHNCEEEMSH